MAKVIWKYPIPIADNFGINMPKGARVLKVAIQNNNPVMWALADDSGLYETRSFFLSGTGQPLNGTGQYIDTFLMNDGSLVLHLFEITNTG
jgi:hypothetical protein